MLKTLCEWVVNVNSELRGAEGCSEIAHSDSNCECRRSDLDECPLVGPIVGCSGSSESVCLQQGLSDRLNEDSKAE